MSRTPKDYAIEHTEYMAVDAVALVRQQIADRMESAVEPAQEITVHRIVSGESYV